MPLREAPKFNRQPFDLTATTLASLVSGYRDVLARRPWTYCGFTPIESIDAVPPPALEVAADVDATFRLGPICGFEQTAAMVTSGFRSSRFAPVLFWEVLHAVAPGGVWIDVDDASRCGGTPLVAEDFPRREYFRSCLQLESQQQHGAILVQTFRKTSPTPLAAHIADSGWTFGILTSGSSPRGAQMAAALLALDLPTVEVVFCGPRPAGLPADERIRAIDLERHERRGWITRKKNLLAATARYDNLCLLHDRFVVTPAWAAALREYGPCFSFLTFPQAFFADLDHRFSQRYADYQVLYQTADVDGSLAFSVYAGSQVLYAPYDDFYETAFCCGGLYVTKRCLWNRVGQDEALFHGEWEDVSFGLECQRRGMPHRVNPLLTVESLAPHPMALTRIHELVRPDTPARGRLHVSESQAAAAQATPNRFTPIVAATKEAYYRKVLTRFNAVPQLPEPDRLTVADVAQCHGLADFWRAIERRIAALPLRTRADVAAVAFFLSDTIYNWPNCELLAAIRATECAIGAPQGLDGFDLVVGWGTGSLFKSTQHALGRELAFVVDSDPSRWGTVVDGAAVKPPSVLLELDPARTAVVAFSCFADEIGAAARALGAFNVFAATELVASRRFGLLADLVNYFDEVEHYYPVLFTDSLAGAAA